MKSIAKKCAVFLLEQSGWNIKWQVFFEMTPSHCNQRQEGKSSHFTTPTLHYFYYVYHYSGSWSLSGSVKAKVRTGDGSWLQITNWQVCRTYREPVVRLKGSRRGIIFILMYHNIKGQIFYSAKYISISIFIYLYLSIYIYDIYDIYIYSQTCLNDHFY